MEGQEMGVKLRGNEADHEKEKSHMIFADNCYLFAETKSEMLKMIGDATGRLKEKGLDNFASMFSEVCRGGSEFFAYSPAALHLLDGEIRRWGRHVLGWPPGSPCAGVLCELGWPDAEHLALGTTLLPFGTLLFHGLGCPVPATVLSVASQSPGTWAHHALAMCAHLDIPSPLAAGIHPQSPPCPSLG